MKKAPPAPTPSHTVNKLGDLTGFDRRTLGKRLANVEPARIERGRKFYTISQATEACEVVRNPAAHKQVHQGETLRGNREHPLYNVVRECSAAGANLHQALASYFTFLDYMEGLFRLPPTDPRRAQFEAEMNLESFGKRVPLNELIFAQGGKGGIGNMIADSLVVVEKLSQNVLDLDSTLQLTGFFGTAAGREMAHRVRKAHAPKS